MMINPYVVFFDPNHGNITREIRQQLKVPIAYDLDYKAQSLQADKWYSFVILDDRRDSAPKFLWDADQDLHILTHQNSQYYNSKRDIKSRLGHRGKVIIVSSFPHTPEEAPFEDLKILASGADATFALNFFRWHLRKNDLDRLKQAMIRLQTISVEKDSIPTHTESLWVAAYQAIEQLDQLPPNFNLDTFHARDLQGSLEQVTACWRRYAGDAQEAG